MLQSRDYVEARFRANSFLSMNISGGWLEPLLEGVVHVQDGIEGEGREGGGGIFYRSSLFLSLFHLVFTLP